MDAVLAIITEDRAVTLEIVGTLDLAGARQLKQQFETTARRGLTSVTVDLGRTECLTSVGISALAVIWELCQQLGTPVRFQNVSRDIQRLFEVAGVKNRFLPE